MCLFGGKINPKGALKHGLSDPMDRCFLYLIRPFFYILENYDNSCRI